MAVIIGSARIDEHGNAKGGKAGDQTGKEVSTQNWYKHKKGWVVLRPKNSACAEKIADDMEYACNNKYIGYDQSQRNTLYNIAKQYDFNCAKVKTACETDCSALVRVCCAYAGIMVKNFRTSDEVETLMATGEFDKLTDKKYTESENYLLRGDILVTKTQGHTVVVLTNGKNATPRNPAYTIKEILVTAKSVYVRETPKGKAIGLAYKGNSFPYIETDPVTNWYKIKYNSRDGWITDIYTIPIYE